MKLAVIETGGKQYLVSAGQKIMVEKLDGKTGEKLTFDKVLMLADGDKVEVGKPYLAGKNVIAELTEQKRLPKVITYKYHSKNRYRNKKGLSICRWVFLVSINHLLFSHLNAPIALPTPKTICNLSRTCLSRISKVMYELLYASLY